MKIIWTDTGEESFQDVLDYLIKFFNHDIALRFYEETINVIESINIYNDIGKRFENSIYRQFIIAKKTSLFYSIREDVIYIHYFFDNRDNPKKLRKKLFI